jgi:uncharacterized membrane protein
MIKDDKKTKIKARKKDIDEGKSLAWLSYFGIFLLIPLLLNPENTFCKHHVKQGIVILALWIVVGILSPFIEILDTVAFLILAVIGVMGIIHAISGNYWKAPLGLYQLSQKINI